MLTNQIMFLKWWEEGGKRKIKLNAEMIVHATCQKGCHWQGILCVTVSRLHPVQRPCL